MTKKKKYKPITIHYPGMNRGEALCDHPNKRAIKMKNIDKVTCNACIRLYYEGE